MNPGLTHELMTSIENARAIRAEKSLDKLVKYEGKIITKREWCKLMYSGGYTQLSIDKKNRVRFNRNHYNRLMGYKAQEEYEARCNEMVEFYKLSNRKGSFFEISKAEFDYINSL